MPTGGPSSRANPTTIFFAKCLMDLEEIFVIGDGVNHVLNVIRLHGIGRDEGIERRIRARPRDRKSRGAADRPDYSAEESSSLANHRQAFGIVAAMKWATPLVALCVIAPPRSSLVTSSWVTVLMTSGPVMNM